MLPRKLQEEESLTPHREENGKEDETLLAEGYSLTRKLPEYFQITHRKNGI